MGLFRRKSVRALAVVLAILVLAIVAVKVFLPAEKIKDLALAEARARLGREVTVGEVSVSLRGGLGVRLADFAIHNPDGFGGDNLLDTRGLDLKLAIRPLLKGEVRVDRLVLDAPHLNLVRRADGSDNFTFPQPAPPKGGSPPAGAAAKAPTPLSIASLSVRDGRIVFSDEGAAAGGLRALRCEGLTLGLGLTDPAPGRYQATGQVAAEHITVTGPGEVPDLATTVDFDLSWDNAAGRLDIARAAADVLGLPLAGTGQVVIRDGQATGAVRLQVQDQPLVALKPFLPAATADKLRGDGGSGTVSATVDLNLTGDPALPVQTTGTVTARDIDLALAQPFLPPEQKGRLAGRGDVDLEFADRTGDPAQISYSGTARARGVSFTESGLIDELQQLDATLAFTPDVFTLKDCRARFASGTLTATGSLRDPFPFFLPPEMQQGKPMKTPHLTFDLRSPRLDVDRLLPAASPTGPAKGGQPGMTRRPPVAAGVTFPALTGLGTVRADTVIYMQVPVTDVTGRVDLKNRVLSVQDIKGNVYRGTIDGKVDIDLNDLNNPGYAGNYAARNIEVDNFVTRFAGLAGVVFGGCNLGGSFAARGLEPDAIRNSLTLDADALLKEGKVITSGKLHQALGKLASETGGSFDKEQALRDLATHIKVENGRVGLNALKARVGAFADVSVDGWYAFNGDLSYNGSLQLTKAETDRIFATGPMAELARLLGSKRPERLTLPLSVGGTRTDPKVKVEVGTVLGDLQKAVVAEQGDKLKDEAKGKLGDLLKKWK